MPSGSISWAPRSAVSTSRCWGCCPLSATVTSVLKSSPLSPSIPCTNHHTLCCSSCYFFPPFVLYMCAHVCIVCTCVPLMLVPMRRCGGQRRMLGLSLELGWWPESPRDLPVFLPCTPSPHCCSYTQLHIAVPGFLHEC